MKNKEKNGKNGAMGTGTGTGAVSGADFGTGADRAASKRAGAVSGACHGSGAQSVIQKETGLKSPKNARKTGAGSAGAEDVNNIVPITAGKGAVKGAEQVQPAVRGADKVQRKKRNDSNQLAVPPDDRVRLLQHNMRVASIGRVQDREDAEEVRAHLELYLSMCLEDQVLPTVAGMALSLGIDRRTLWTWMSGKVQIKSQAAMDTLKGVYMMINAQYESMLTTGKIIPVAGFFLLQNNYGYENQQKHVLIPEQPADPDTADLAARAGLLEDGGADPGQDR